MRTGWRWAVAAAMLASLALPAGADDGGPRPAPPAGEQGGVLRLLPPPSTTHHTLALADRSLAYTVTAGTLPLRDGKGATVAAVFHLAYVADPASVARPITFVFNGGPGAASAFLNLGGLGPRMVALAENGGYLTPPSRLVDNPDSWLDFTDLVFVDPVGTGYSRAAEEGEEADRRFLGVSQDASSMAAFIRLYLARAQRSLSPVFLAGESYGGFRAALLTRVLPEESGVTPSGAVLISPALELSLLNGEDYDPLRWALPLPSLAAVNLERHGAAPEAVAERRDEAERFARGDYLVGLAAGAADLPPAALDMVTRLTGLPAPLVAESRGRISLARFVKEYDRAAGRVLSRYDGTIDGPDPDPRAPEPHGPDPLLDRAAAVWSSAFVAYVRGELGYETDVTYRILNREIGGRWDYGTSPSRQGYAGALDDLQRGRTLNPALEVLVATGDADLVTPYFATRYLLDQLPPLAGAAPVTFRVYPGGHMVYMRPASRQALAADVRALYRRAVAAVPLSPGGGP